MWVKSAVSLHGILRSYRYINKVINSKTKRKFEVNGLTFAKLIEEEYDYFEAENKLRPKENLADFLVKMKGDNRQQLVL